MRSLWDINELAEWLNITVDAVRQRRYRDPESMPPAIVLGKSLRWDPEVVEVWLKERQEKTPTGVGVSQELASGANQKAGRYAER